MMTKHGLTSTLDDRLTLEDQKHNHYIRNKLYAYLVSCVKSLNYRTGSLENYIRHVCCRTGSSS